MKTWDTITWTRNLARIEFLQIADDLVNERYEDALRKVGKVAIDRESVSLFVRCVLPVFSSVDRSTIEKIDSWIHSKAYDVFKRAAEEQLNGNSEMKD